MIKHYAHINQFFNWIELNIFKKDCFCELVIKVENGIPVFIEEKKKIKPCNIIVDKEETK